ncbi:putative protein NEOXANTHIN-DEFICIENT 1 [Helianthus annuus]|nr:putative protein NEOXANTHIN-DEFICIENT 1 [Helianthus annuus]
MLIVFQPIIYSQEFGLPSQVATFSKVIDHVVFTLQFELKFRFLTLFTFKQSITAISDRPERNGKGSNVNIRVAEIDGPVTTGLYDIRLESPISKTNPLKWMALGPTIKMSLPSFSGHTEYIPQLLKYSCQIECRVKPTSPARVLGSTDRIESQNVELNESSKKREMSISVMLSKPILALEFNCLKMEVQPPIVVSKGSHHPLEHGYNN